LFGGTSHKIGIGATVRNEVIRDITQNFNSTTAASTTAHSLADGKEVWGVR
jgi:hypothetical protein